jgi:predicted RNA methylase
MPKNSETESLREIEFILKTAKANPSDVHFQLKAANVLSKFLPSWHIPMVHDHARNDFYERMIKKEVKNKTVLDIGTGTGFLALLAAEHGAKHVYACEQNPLFYTLAKQNIEASPHHDKITLIYGSSTKLKIGRDLPEKVDLLVSEIISTSIFSERMLLTLKNAKRLIQEGGKFLPQKVEVYACLIRFEGAPDSSNSRKVFDSLIDFGRKVPVINNLHHKQFEVLSAPELLTTIDDGFVLSEGFPMRFHLRQKVASHDSQLCVYFKICDGDDYISNFDLNLSSRYFARSWGILTWPVAGARKENDFELHLGSDQRLVLVGPF